MQNADQAYKNRNSMKKPLLLIIFAFIILTRVSSQSCLPDGIIFTTQTQIDSFHTDYPGCTEIEGFVRITGNDIKNLSGLNGVTSIGGNLSVSQTDSLINFTGLNTLLSIGDQFITGWWENNMNLALQNFVGLERLKTVGSNFSVRANLSLIDFTGLDSLRSVGNMEIGYNEMLTSLSGLVSLDSIHYGLTVSGTESLLDLAGLSNLSYVNHYVEIKYNESLISLSGLDNLSPNSIDYFMTIINNDSLSFCEAQSVCQYLADSNSNVTIYNNYLGCNSPEEVTEACLVGYSTISDIEKDIVIYPNPTQNKLSFISISNSNNLVVKIYNINGKMIMSDEIINNSIDLTILKSGLYIIEITIDNKIIRKKLFKK